MSEDGAGPNLLNVHGCVQELHDCSNGLIGLDHLYASVLDNLDAKEERFEVYEARAAEYARKQLGKSATATEIRALMDDWIQNEPAAREARSHYKEAKRTKAKLERFFRSLEKRITAAQTARNAHEHLSKAAG